MVYSELVNNDLIITLPRASKYLIGLANGKITCFSIDKFKHPLCKSALKLDVNAIPSEVLNNIPKGEISFIISSFEEPYDFYSVMRNILRGTEQFSSQEDSLKILDYINSKKEQFKFSPQNVIDIFKLCNLFQSLVNYTTLSFTLKNAEITNKLNIRPEAVTSALKVMEKLKLIETVNRRFGKVSLPRRIFLTHNFFIETLGLTEEEIINRQNNSIENFNLMMKVKHKASYNLKKYNDVHYYKIIDLINNYDFLIKKKNNDEINKDELKERLTEEVAKVISKVVEEKSVITQQIIEVEEDENTIENYSQDDITSAIDLLEKSVIHTRKKAKDFILKSNITNPDVLKALAYML